MTPCFTKDKFVRVRVRVSVRVLDRVAGAKYAGKNVVGHDVLGQDDGNRSFQSRLEVTMTPNVHLYMR